MNTIIPDTPHIITTLKSMGDAVHRRGPSSVIFVIACLAYFGLAADELRQTAHFGSLFPLAARLEEGVAASPDVLDRYVSLTDEVVTAGYCRSDIVMAGATVLLADLDRQNQSLAYDKWADAIGRGENYFAHAIACTPLNGNYWLRLAMIRRAEAERPVELVALIHQSIILAPAEQDIIIARLFFWKAAGNATLEAGNSLIQGDITSVLRNGKASDLALTLKALAGKLAPYFRAVAPLISVEKASEWKTAGFDINMLR